MCFYVWHIKHIASAHNILRLMEGLGFEDTRSFKELMTFRKCVILTWDGIDEVVDDDHLIPRLKQFDDGVTTDETSSPGHEHGLLGIHFGRSCLSWQ